MNIVKFFAVLLAAALFTLSASAEGISFFHRSSDGRVNGLSLQFAPQQQMRVVPVPQQGQFPHGTRINWECAADERPVPVNGLPACAHGNRARLVPESEWEVILPSNQNRQRYSGGQDGHEHAGTVPADSGGRCPRGMVPSPRTPNQLPGCW